MSRHRFVKNINLEDEMGEDYDEYDEYDEEYYDESQPQGNYNYDDYGDEDYEAYETGKKPAASKPNNSAQKKTLPQKNTQPQSQQKPKQTKGTATPTPSKTPSSVTPSVSSSSLSQQMSKLTTSDADQKSCAVVEEDDDEENIFSTKRSTPKELPAYTPNPKLQKEKDTILSEEKKHNEKARVSVVVIGHVDAGKSTMMGHLLYLMGRVSQKQMHKYEKESKEKGKASFHFAWVLDEEEEERERGVTVDVAVQYFETEHRYVTLLDAPGHRDFIPNMISGTAQADAAILVIPASTGEFESGFADDGQTKEHALLARSLGVHSLIIAVNKMDSVEWNKARFQEIQDKLTPFLHSSGFKEKDITFIPVSGLIGENLTKCTEPKLLSWYSNRPTLVQLIDDLQPPARQLDKPFRMSVSEVFRLTTTSAGGLIAAGKVLTGAVIPKDKVLVLPGKELATVKSVECRGEPLLIGKAGENIELSLRDLPNENLVMVGHILCDPSSPVPLVKRFRAQVLTLNCKLPILHGTQCVLHTQSSSEPATITKLVGLLDKTTGQIQKKNPRVITKNSNAEIEITLSRPVCLELYKEYKELGRFTLRRDQETIVVGIVAEIYEKE